MALETTSKYEGVIFALLCDIETSGSESPIYDQGYSTIRRRLGLEVTPYKNSLDRAVKRRFVCRRYDEGGWWWQLTQAGRRWVQERLDNPEVAMSVAHSRWIDAKSVELVVKLVTIKQNAKRTSATCPRCGVEAGNIRQVEEIFGWRKVPAKKAESGFVYKPQSCCRSCRSAASRKKK